jgi:hypothetical protein
MIPCTKRHPRYGRSLVEFDQAAEARLRLKIDLYIIPTVSLLYLFCFIDRANIGTYLAHARYVVSSTHFKQEMQGSPGSKRNST